MTVGGDAAGFADFGEGAIGDVATVGSGACHGEIGDGLDFEEVHGSGEGVGQIEKEAGEDEDQGIMEIHGG